MSEAIEVALLDYDGVVGKTVEPLLDTFVRVCSEFGFECSREHARATNTPGNSTWYARAFPGCNAQAMADKHGEIFLDHPNSADLYDDVLPTMSLLRERGIRMAVVSAKPISRLVPAIRENGVIQHLKQYYGKGSTPYMKPDGRLMTLVLRAMGVEPSRAVYVGDTTFDMQFAENGGVQGIAATYGMGYPDHVTAFTPYRINAFTELPRVLERM